MAINIHFFRNNTLDKLDFGKVLEFFDELPNFEIYYTANDVEIVYTDKEFQFSYSYLITKVSQVRQIYKLNPAFVNVNFLLQLPILVPEYVVKEILTVTQRLCKLFELEVFNDAFEDVKPFNLMDIIMLFKAARRAYIEENGLEGKILFDTDKLNSICKYQRSIDNICEWYHHEVQVDYCEPVIDRKTGEYGICCVWNIGIPTVFPPYFDYVKIKDEDDQEFMVRRKDFFFTRVVYSRDMTVLKFLIFIVYSPVTSLIKTSFILGISSLNEFITIPFSTMSFRTSLLEAVSARESTAVCLPA